MWFAYRKKLQQMKEQEEKKKQKESGKVKDVSQLEQLEEIVEVDETRAPVSLVFIGHVDAGKSTISGSIMYLNGAIDQRTI